MRRRKVRLAAMSGAAILGLAACGGGGAGDGDSRDAAGGGEQVSIEALDNEFKPTQLKVPAGEEVTVTLENAGNNPHTFTSKDLDVDTGVVEGGASKTVTFTAPDSGTEFVCVIHERQGMTGTIVPE